MCIKLFPNCKWSAENVPLQPLTSISQFIGSFHLNSQRNKTRRQQQQQQQQQVQQQQPQQQQLQQQVQLPIEIIDSFDEFKNASKTSDELALLLIQLLSRCVDAEQEPQLSVTVHNFALGHLCSSCVDEREQELELDLPDRKNDEIIKFELLQLIAQCVNNFYIHEQQPSSLDFNSQCSQLLYALAANRSSSMLSHAVLYIMFGTLHNLVEFGAQQLTQIDVKHFDTCFDVLQEAAASTTCTSLLFLHIYKLLLRLTDHLSRQEQQLQCLMESSTSSALVKQQQQNQPPRYKRLRHSQLHCTERSLTCYFQGKLYQLLPNLVPELQEHTVRSLLRTGSCCCHYNATNYATCLRLATQLSGSYQKCAYKFLHYNVLHTIFVKRSPQHCAVCEEKLKSPAFHTQLLSIYKDSYRALLNSGSMLLFLKHLKHIAYLLSYDLAAGILAEVALPVFRQYKQLSDCKTKANPVHKLPRLQLPCKLENYRILHECLSIFVMYLSDIRLVKAFYNEENIGYMQDLLCVPELQRGVCDLIKVGIDNIAFLGDNSHEQIALSRRLIQLQLNSSDRASRLFQALLHRCAKRSNVKFWLEESANTSLLEGHKPVDILYITALQWTLNYELLKTSQLFYNEFAKIYSIPVEMTVDDDDDAEEEQQQQQQQLPQLEQEEKLRHGDKTIIDILKLNYNALSCFLMLPKAAVAVTSTAATTPATPTMPSIRGSSSLEALVSHVQLPLSLMSASATTAASSDYADSSLDYASVINNYAEQPALPSFLQQLQSSQPDESIVLFDIRGSQPNNNNNSKVESVPLALTSVVAEDEVAAAGLISKLFNIVGSLFGGSTASPEQRATPEPSLDIDADLFCLYEPNGECKKLLLKLFEATMAICIKGFQNEEGELATHHKRV